MNIARGVFHLKSKPKIRYVLPLFAALLASCNGSGEDPLNKELSKIIKQNNITGDPRNINGDINNKRQNLPSIESDLAILGRKIFFTKAYSLNKDAACVSCHHPFLAGADALSLPVGVDAIDPDLLGSGRIHNSSKPEHDGNFMGPRNTPTLFNVVFYDEQEFWDGKVETISKISGARGINDIVVTPRMRFKAMTEASDDIANGLFDFDLGLSLDLSDTVVSNNNSLTANQARFPVLSPTEMRGFDASVVDLDFKEVWKRLEDRFRGEGDIIQDNKWLGQFRVAFNSPTGTKKELITEENISIAIGEYEDSQIFIENPWKHYVEGNFFSLSRDAKEGAKLFFNSIEEGGANCASCHSGDFFTDEKFHIIGMPQVGRGTPNPVKDNASYNDDKGRFLMTFKRSDEYAWRTPSLLNVATTGPWGHSGAYTTLEQVVTHYNNPQEAIDNYDFSQIDSTIDSFNMKINTQAALDRLARVRKEGTDENAIPEKLSLSEIQIKQLVAFLESLTDPCVLDKECLAPWVPQSDEFDPDGMRLKAKFNKTIAQ